MDEQPVALAIRARSPKSWETSFKYGVSPHPAHAPENSKSGGSSWLSLTEVKLSILRSGSGSVWKNSQLMDSCMRSGACGAMLIAFRPEALLFLAGQASTHRPQPVQSSGATCKL